MDKNETIRKFKRKLCSVFGYDEDLKFAGTTERPPRGGTGSKAFLEPRDFLTFAIEDSVALEEEKSRINCLSNCKRAMDSQIDRVIRRLGFFPLARKKQWNISRKLEFISQSGIVAPKILRNVNRLRNRLEHEFAVPSKQQVEDALEIATLFVCYAELVQIPSLNWTLADEETVRYDYEEMVFHFFEKNPDDMSESNVEPVLSVAHGDARFQDFYEFLTKSVPSMIRKGPMGEDV